MCALLRRAALMVIILLLGYVPVRAQNTPIAHTPYLYYFSHTLNAFVIERADGSDSRLLGQGVMPNTERGDYWDVADAQWSASHRWLAWVGNQGCCSNYGLLWLFRADTSARVPIAQTITDVVDMAWSPTHDVLLVSTLTGVYLLNPDLQKILGQFHFNQNSSVAGARIRWLFDGEHAAFDIEPYQGTFDVSGALTVNIAFEEDQGFGSCRMSGGTITSGGDWTASGSYLSQSLVFKNRLSNATFALRLKDQWLVGMDLSPDGRYALIYLNTHCNPSDDRSANQIGIVSTADRTIQFFSQPHFIAPYYWLVNWSPDAQKGIIQIDDSTYKVVDLTTRQIYLVIDQSVLVPKTEYAPMIYLGDRLQWTSDSQEILINFSQTSYRYTLADQRLTYVMPGISYTQSPDSKYVAFSLYELGAQHLYTQDRRTGERHLMLPPSGADYAGSNVIWHPTENWLIIEDGTPTANGEHLFPMYTVSNVDGTIQRELTKEAFIGWLPFDPAPDPQASSRSVSGQPRLTLTGPTRAIAELAWYPDHKQVASITDDGAVRVWDTSTGAQTISIDSIRASRYVAYFTAFQWTNDGRHLLSLDDNNTLTLWDTVDGKAKNICGSDASWKLAPITSQMVDYARLQDGAVVFGTADNCNTRTLLLPSSHPVSAFYFSPDGKRWVLSDAICNAYVYDALTAQLLSTFQLPGCDTLLIAPDGTRLLTTYQTGSVGWITTEWNMATGQEISFAECGIGWSLANKAITTAACNEQAAFAYRTANADTGQQIGVIASTDDLFTEYRLSPDGTRLAAVNEGYFGYKTGFIVWDVGTGAVLARYAIGGRTLAWSHDGTQIAVASGYTVQLWDALSPFVLPTF